MVKALLSFIKELNTLSSLLAVFYPWPAGGVGLVGGADASGVLCVFCVLNGDSLESQVGLSE